MGGVVDHGQALHAPPIRRAIEDEVRGPDLVATLGAHQGLTVGSRDLLASTARQLEPGLRVQAIDPFVIDDVAGLPPLQIDHPGPRAWRCCTNRHWPAQCQSTRSSPADAIRHWSAEGGHPIEDLTADDGLTPLPSWTPGAKAIADDGLVSEERILHPALTMVP